MNDLPRISIIIPTRNRARYLKRGIDKILESDYPNLEIIIIDGASTDDTIQLVQSYGDRITKWISEKDDGEHDALNKGIMMSTGEYIMHFTDDDVIIPSSFRIIGEFLANNREFDIVFAQVNLWKEIDGIPFRYGVTKYLDPEAIKPNKYFRVSPGPPTQGAFVKRQLFEQIGLHLTDYIISDYEFWARAIHRGAKCALLPVVVADYHFTGENTVIKKADQIRQDYIRIASTYASKSDLFYVIKQLWIQDYVKKIGKIAHIIGFHPLRWFFNRKIER